MCNFAHGDFSLESMRDSVIKGGIEGTTAFGISWVGNKISEAMRPSSNKQFSRLTEAEAAETYGGAKDPNWRPGGAKGVENSEIFWGRWSDYPKVNLDGNEYARVGKRLYSRHAIDRIQPSGNKYGSNIIQAGGDYGRSVAPSYVESVINSVQPIVQENGNLKYVMGTIEVITNSKGCVVTVMTK